MNMALINAHAMFKLFPAKAVYKQRVKLRPIEHHYENDGEPPYIKYSCQICEQLAKNAEGFPLYSDDEDDEDGKFVRFSFPEGTPNCPCCGINIDWNYKPKSTKNQKQNYETNETKKV